MGSVRFGAEQAIRNCLRVKPEDRVVLIGDRATAPIDDALAEVIRETGAPLERFVMEQFGARPESGDKPLDFPDAIRDVMRKATVSIYAASGKKGELTSFRGPMIREVDAKPDLRHAHMIGITGVIMEMGMSADYVAIQALSARVAGIVRGSRRIRVTSPAGTDFTVGLNPAWKWLVSDGAITPEQWKNLPDGEVYTCAETARGRAVVDGCMGDYFNDLGSCESFPVTIDIANGVATRLVCPARPSLEKELNEYIHQDEHANRVGEFAIGTNTGLDRIIGNLLQDEKFPGVHIAFGHGYPDQTGSPWRSKAHVDMVMRRVSIEVDGKVIMKEGKFLI